MAPLVLEESRCIIAESLTTLSSSRQRNNHQQQQQQFSLELVSMNEKYPKYTKQHRLTAPLILNFQIVATNSDGGGLKYRHDRRSSSNYDSSNNISSSMKWTRPGNVLLLRRQQKQRQQQQHDSSNNLQNSVLACIVPNGGNRQSESSSSSSSSTTTTLSLMIVRRGELNLDEELCTQSCFFVATAVTTVISQVRQMEACLRMVKVSFIRKVLGQKDAIHTRFDSTSDDDDDYDDDDQEDEELLVKYDDRDDFLPLDDEDCTTTTTTTSIDGVTANNDWNEDMSHLLTQIPTLNETQERAATMFLNSPKESIILVQGRE
jgi:hypothetical protein